MQSDIPVKEIMTREVCTARKDDTLLTASKKMIKFGVGSVVVIEDGRPIGIVTEKDILYKVVSKNKLPSKVKLKDIMSTPLITIKPTTSLREAADIMRKRGIRRLPVVDDNGNLIGIVTDNDILSVVIDLGEFAELLKNEYYEVEEMSGKCEKCGRISDRLYDIEGLKVCEDCYEVLR
ncbi:putative signal transduction protein with CBS domains [Archaeoglobus profundus DSM 5631]|uniref:Signal transduction protein with CBS domains n=2 Tax=Archaeoglobus profundus TaxID=84156 RepID=D2RE10_ARCPA|nr:putative signal transduction protein with CBS domains [Archaeoglobus profundus DSM 5631]